MPITPTYPGVYIEEIPSGVRTITGVATSITAFIGRAARGETNNPITLTSFGDFERRCGGLNSRYPMSYAVRDFYLNAGGQATAIVVRLSVSPTRRAAQEVVDAAEAAANQNGATAQSVATAASNAATAINGDATRSAEEKSAASAVDTAAGAAAGQQNATPQTILDAAREAAEAFTGKAKLALPASASGNGNGGGGDGANEFRLEAASPGEWGNSLKVKVDREGITGEVARRYNLQQTDLFNLTIREGGADGQEERILNVSVVEGPRRVDRVLARESELVRVQEEDGEPHLPPNPPLDTPVATVNGNGNGDGDGNGNGDGDGNGNGDGDGNGNGGTASGNGGGLAVAVLPLLAGTAAEEAKFAGPFTGGERSTVLGTQDYTGSETDKTGLFALENADLFNLLCIPPDVREGDTPKEVYQLAMAYCARRRAMLIVDPPAGWSTNKAVAATRARDAILNNELGLSGPPARNAALYVFRVLQADPEREGQIAAFAPSGIIAGVMASTDVQRGVWKAPAGTDATLAGIDGLEVELNDSENGMLNPLGINCLRTFPVYGSVVWGARTLRGADQLADEYKYVPVRRLALFLEESLYRGLKWVVFEPNDEPLWGQIRLNVGAFMQNLFRQGAFQGTSPRDAYLVKCDSETTTQTDVDRGIVNILVGFAPLKPAEFVIVKIQQLAGQVQT